MQAFPWHVVHLLYSHFKAYGLPDLQWDVNVLKWSEKWQGILHGLDAETLLAVEARAPGMTLKNTFTNQLQNGTRILAARRIGKGDVVEKFYGSLVYNIIVGRQYAKRTYGEFFLV